MLLQRLVHHVVQVVGIDRLRDVVEGAFLQGLDCGVHGGEGRDHDDNDVLACLPDALQELNAVHAGHLDIHKHDVPGACLQLPQCGGGAFRGVNAEAVLPEPFAERFADDELVVHHKYADLTFVHSWFPSTEDDIDC